VTLVYKICPEEAWAKAVKSGHFNGAGIDLSDGYIHLSTGEQLRETAHRHFANGDDLMLIVFEDSQLQGLKYEASRGGALFPHVYGTIKTDIALSANKLTRGSDGHLVLPDNVP
jgi:uncharacterized protein (DUF952 family)